MGDEAFDLDNILPFKLALEAFVQESCLILSGMELFSSVYFRATLVDEKHIGPRWQTTQEMRLSLPILERKFLHEVGKLASSGLVIQALRDNPTLLSKLVIPLEESEWLISERHLRGDIWIVLLGPYLELCWSKHNSIIFDEQVFDEVFEEVIADIKSQGVETEVQLTPIAKVKISEPIELAPGLRIRPLTSEDIESWFNHSWSYTGHTFNLGDILFLQCAIEATYHRSLEDQAVENLMKRIQATKEESETTSKVLGDMRLLMNQPMHMVFTQKSRRSLLWRRMDIVLPQTPKPSMLGARHVAVTVEQSQELIKLWQKLQSSNVADEINLPFRRWYGAGDRLSEADRLIDYWVGLEALFSPDATQEVKFRASLRIAAYLGETPDEWEAIYQEMRHSYDWRSTVVHGADLSAQKKLDKKGTLPTITAKTHGYLRKAILKLLESDEKLSIKPGESEIKLLRRLGEK